MLKRICTFFLCAVLMGASVPCSAIHIDDFNIGEDKLMITGKLNKPDKGALIDLWMEDDSKNIVVIRQTRADDNGGYSFDIDLSKSLKKGGKFTVSVTSQTEGMVKYISDSGSEYVNLYTSEETDAVLRLLFENKQNIQANKETIELNKEILKYKIPLLKSLPDDNGSYELAVFIKNSDYAEDNAALTLTEIAEIKVVQNGNKEDIYTLLNTDGCLNGLKDDVVFKKMDKGLFEKFSQRLAASDNIYNSVSEFLNDVEDVAAVTQLYEVRGADGIEKTLKRFSEKFDFAVYESSENDRKLVLNMIEKAVENNTITSCKQVQEILDKYIKKTEDSGSSSGGGSSSRGGSSGGVKSTVKADADLISNPVFDMDNVATEEKTFSDLDNYKWAEESINELVKAGIADGVSDTEFAPERTITRAEFCKLIFKIFGMKESTDNNRFTDVSKDDWYAPYIWTLSDIGAINGIDLEHFAPNLAISRQDVCTIIYRMLKREQNELMATAPTFEDSDTISEYAKEAVAALQNANLIKGEDGRFAPDREMNRAEAAVLAARVHSYRNGGHK